MDAEYRPRTTRARARACSSSSSTATSGVLANGAGLTMTTLDAVNHYGGRPANFLEIGGDAYTKATPALALVLDNPRVKSLLVNFCGAFARTDVMAEGVVNAIEELRPELPVVLLHPRHRRGRGDRPGARSARLRALRPDGRRGAGRGRGRPRATTTSESTRERADDGHRKRTVVVQGITGRQGSFWTGRMLECGTRVVAGATPRQGRPRGGRHPGLRLRRRGGRRPRRSTCRCCSSRRWPRRPACWTPSTPVSRKVVLPHRARALPRRDGDARRGAPTAASRFSAPTPRVSSSRRGVGRHHARLRRRTSSSRATSG